jgi:uncharacterized protein
MLLVNTVLKPSEIHGLGCFANEPIKKGQEIWRYDRRVDLAFKESKVSKYPNSFQKYLYNFCYTVKTWRGRYLVLCGDNGKYMNHSDQPNIVNNPYGVNNMACRDIDVGEELTCDYSLFDLDADVKLQKS